MEDIGKKPDGRTKWNVTNLDGSFHNHVKYGGSSEQQQTTIPSTTSQSRQDAIAQAHEENIEASKHLAASINRLAAAIEKYITGKDDHLEDEFT
jgi:hypothetical protein